jgi:hypothetical protein
MAFHQTTITAVNPPVLNGYEYLISWQTTSPPGTWWQIYVNRVLASVGQTTSELIPIPQDLTQIDIGWVDPGDEYIDFSADLPPAPATFAVLGWEGGTFESPDIAGFNVYGGDSPGASVDFTTPLAAITAYPSGIITDGFGLGGFGDGGFGEAASSYTWTSGSLASGTWNFAVVPFDSAGNAGTAAMTSCQIFGPPLEPGFLSGTAPPRIMYDYSPTTFEAVLTWGASPSA